MFKYNPEDATSCLPEGEATMVLIKAEDKVSRAGNDMAVITFDAYVGERKGRVTEYIVNPTTLYKLKQIAKALGSKAVGEFDKGEFDPNAHAGETLRAVLAIDSQDGFDDKNVVKKYLAAGDAAPAPKPVDSNAADCPF